MLMSQIVQRPGMLPMVSWLIAPKLTRSPDT
jgi:hypothetical protein